MKQLGIAVTVYLAVVLQTVAANASWFNRFTPDLLFLTAVMAVMSNRGSVAILWAATIGLLSDCLTSGHLGVDMALMTATALFIRKFSESRFSSSLLAIALTIFVTAAAFEFASIVIRTITNGLSLEFGSLTLSVIAHAAGTLLLGLIAIGTWRAIKRILPERGDRSSSTEFRNRWSMLTD